jgi:hypothetical protein
MPRAPWPRLQPQREPVHVAAYTVKKLPRALSPWHGTEEVSNSVHGFEVQVVYTPSFLRSPWMQEWTLRPRISGE